MERSVPLWYVLWNIPSLAVISSIRFPTAVICVNKKHKLNIKSIRKIVVSHGHELSANTVLENWLSGAFRVEHSESDKQHPIKLN